MKLITPVEVSSLAFFNALDSDFVLPAYITTAENNYVIPLVTQPVFDAINANPENYTVLIEDYIKPYEAFCIKYIFYNQFLTETDTFAISDEQRLDAIKEIVTIKESLHGQLLDYLNANIFETPVVSDNSLVGGLLTRTSVTASATRADRTDVTSTLKSASADSPVDADTVNFIQSTSSLLKKMTWASFVTKIKSYFGSTANLNHWQGTQAEYNGLGTYADDTLYLIH